MTRRLFFCFVLLLANQVHAASPYRPLEPSDPAQACHLGEWKDDSTVVLNGCPEDAQDVVRRALECQHWAGEDPYDNARGHEIETAMRELHCDALSADYHAVMQKYAQDADVIDTMERADREFSLEF